MSADQSDRTRRFRMWLETYYGTDFEAPDEALGEYLGWADAYVEMAGGDAFHAAARRLSYAYQVGKLAR
jgi:hypothetical protein